MGTDANQNPGCLGSILRLFGIGAEVPRSDTSLPYRQRDDFLSPAELSFYRALSAAVGNRAHICPKVNLADIFFVVKPNENQGARGRISQKHVDFLLCDSQSMKPLVGIELDDSSHARADRQERDALVDAVFAVAALPLVRIPALGATARRTSSRNWRHICRGQLRPAQRRQWRPRSRFQFPLAPIRLSKVRSAYGSSDCG